MNSDAPCRISVLLLAILVPNGLSVKETKGGSKGFLLYIFFCSLSTLSLTAGVTLLCSIYVFTQLSPKIHTFFSNCIQAV